MAVVEVMSVGCMDRWTHGSMFFQPCPFDQTDVKFTLLIHPRCACAFVDVQDLKCGTWQVQPHLPCVVRWLVHVP
jgi:hypothetical protein